SGTRGSARWSGTPATRSSASTTAPTRPAANPRSRCESEPPPPVTPSRGLPPPGPPGPRLPHKPRTTPPHLRGAGNCARDLGPARTRTRPGCPASHGEAVLQGRGELRKRPQPRTHPHPAHPGDPREPPEVRATIATCHLPSPSTPRSPPPCATASSTCGPT